MNRIAQHIPNFVDYRDPTPVAEFETLAELLAVPWVRRWAEDAKFHRYSLSGHHLMAERDGGAGWSVVGYLDSTKGLGLPKWVSPDEPKPTPPPGWVSESIAALREAASSPEWIGDDDETD